jgi:hypothetical protein
VVYYDLARTALADMRVKLLNPTGRVVDHRNIAAITTARLTSTAAQAKSAGSSFAVPFPSMRRLYRQMVNGPPKPPMPRRAISTVRGVTHRLIWSDKHAGYRMRCSCGWIDPKLRLSERRAIDVGNAHVGGVRRVAAAEQRRRTEMSKSPEQRQVGKTARRTGGIVLLLLVAVLVIGLALANAATHNSYNDGYQWGQGNTVGAIDKTAPSCSRSEMVSSAQVNDPNFIFHKPRGMARQMTTSPNGRRVAKLGHKTLLRVSTQTKSFAFSPALAGLCHARIL